MVLRISGLALWAAVIPRSITAMGDAVTVFSTPFLARIVVFGKSRQNHEEPSTTHGRAGTITIETRSSPGHGVAGRLDESLCACLFDSESWAMF